MWSNDPYVIFNGFDMVNFSSLFDSFTLMIESYDISRSTQLT